MLDQATDILLPRRTCWRVCEQGQPCLYGSPVVARQVPINGQEITGARILWSNRESPFERLLRFGWNIARARYHPGFAKSGPIICVARIHLRRARIGSCGLGKFAALEKSRTEGAPAICILGIVLQPCFQTRNGCDRIPGDGTCLEGGIWIISRNVPADGESHRGSCNKGGHIQNDPGSP